MRIAVLAHMHYAIRPPYAGGLEMHTDLTVDHLVRLGHEVTVFAKEGTRTAGTVVPLVAEDFDPTVRTEQDAVRRRAVLMGAMIEACRQEIDRLAITREVLSGLVTGPVGAGHGVADGREPDRSPSCGRGPGQDLLEVLAGPGPRR